MVRARGESSRRLRRRVGGLWAPLRQDEALHGILEHMSKSLALAGGLIAFAIVTVGCAQGAGDCDEGSCVAIACDEGSGIQAQGCGDGADCIAVGECESCFPGKFVETECSTLCSVDDHCAYGAECDGLNCVANTSKQVPCDPDNVNPANSDDILVDVSIAWTPDLGWDEAALCDWECHSDYFQEADSCIDEREVDCVDVAPEHATSVIVSVNVEYSSAGGWSDPAECLWLCDDGYQDRDGNDSCEPKCALGSCGSNGVCDDESGYALCTYTSCYFILAADPAAGDGIYEVDPDGPGGAPSRAVYCDMLNGGWSYEALGFGLYDRDLAAPYSGWLEVGVTDFQRAAFRQAFIWSYNLQAGLENLEPGATGDNCCFKGADSGDQELHFGPVPNYLYPADQDGTNNCGGPYDDAFMRFHLHDEAAPTNLPGNYFDSGVYGAHQCAESSNPAFFVRRYTGLASCAEILAAGLSVGDDIYLVDPDGIGSEEAFEVVCDMTRGGYTIGGVGFGQYNVSYTNWELMPMADFAVPAVQLAFVWNYSRHGGFLNLAPGWSSGNCCFKVADIVGTLNFGGTDELTRIYPANQDGSDTCNSVPYTDPYMRFRLSNAQGEPVPLTRDYFATRPPMEATGCADDNNPGFFLNRWL